MVRGSRENIPEIDVRVAGKMGELKGRISV